MENVLIQKKEYSVYVKMDTQEKHVMKLQRTSVIPVHALGVNVRTQKMDFSAFAQKDLVD